MCSLPAGSPWPHLLSAAKTHTTDTRPHPHTGNTQGPPALTGRCQRPPRSPGLAGLSPGPGTRGRAPPSGFFKCEVQSHPPANARASPGRRRSCPGSKSSYTRSQKGPRKPNVAVVWGSPARLRPRSAARGFRAKGAPARHAGALPGPQTSPPRASASSAPPGRELTCGCWAGSCGRPGTRSPVAGGSWRCAGRG